ncbi:MAG: hypothetical protein U1E05_00675 [Patescibacteria group bacterium]|nr:hypothetical protein [Patescibacteria group bacterium]
MSVRSESVTERLQLSGRRRAAVATAVSAMLLFGGLCWFAYSVHNAMSHAELSREIKFQHDPLDPECIHLAYLPVSAGRLLLRRTGRNRVTEFVHEVTRKEVGRRQVLLWRPNGLRNGERLTVFYRDGWRITTHESQVSHLGQRGEAAAPVAN